MAAHPNQPGVPQAALAQPTFEIVDGASTTHGTGRFTTGFIPRGKEIQKEKPFFHMCAGVSTFPPATMQDPRWQTWLNLPLPGPSPTSTGLGAIHDRFRATSIRCGVYRHDKKDVKAYGVFLQACRFNSSCQPNVQAHWNPSTECMHFLALRNIGANEELYICYDPATLLFPRAERQQRWRTMFGFSCNCVSCSQRSSGSDTRRRALKPIIEGVPIPLEVPPNLSDDERKRFVQTALENSTLVTRAIQYLRDEGLYHYADTLHFDLYRAQMQAGEHNNAMLCLLTARNLTRSMVGSEDGRGELLTEMLRSDWHNDNILDCRAACCKVGVNQDNSLLPNVCEVDKRG